MHDIENRTGFFERHPNPYSLLDRRGGPAMTCTDRHTSSIRWGQAAASAIAMAALYLPVPASSDPSSKSFCADTKAALAADYELSQAADAVFGHLRTLAGHTDCIRPYRLLRYGDADVLLALKADPGLDGPCHGCGGDLSAFVLKRLPGALKVVARFPAIGTFGTFGDPGRIDAIQFDGHDAIVLAYGGTFQGFSSTKLSVFIFRAGRLVELQPGLPLGAGDGGAKGDDATSVDAAWRVEAGGGITIDYRVTDRAGARSAHASWKATGDRLVPVSGAPPSEWAKAGGG